MANYLYQLARDKPCPCGQEWGKYQGFMAGIIKVFLLLISFIYGLIVKILIFFYCLKPRDLSCKVISVGNITLGGTGKTVLVEYIARYLRSEGHKVAILTRGYKRKLTTYNLKLTTYEMMGDEPYMLSKKLGDIPVIVDADRIRGANLAIRDYTVDTIILDDGFQQWRIKKDLEIVTIDATDPFGNRYLIPRGILREPLSSFRRPDVLMLTKTNLNPDIQDIKDFLIQINPTAQIFESLHHPLGFYALGKSNDLLNTEALKGKTATLISGIADPDSFENLIISLGINIGLSFRFPDHYHYRQGDLDKVFRESEKKNIETIITTEKDTVRINNLQLTTYNLQLFVLRIELKIIKNEQEFHSRLLKLYSH